MSKTLQAPLQHRRSSPTPTKKPASQPSKSRVQPSIIEPAKTSANAKPFTLDQELELFGTWVGDPVWVPPKDASSEMAESMRREHSPWVSAEKRWNTVIETHRSAFTQVREIDMVRASIRLPKGKLFVSVTEQKDFDKITDEIPACVQTRLDEFLAGPMMRKGAKVYYLEPLCVEVGDDLIFTTREEMFAAVTKIQDEVFAEYRRLYLGALPKQIAAGTVNAGLAIPRALINFFVARRERAIKAYHARLEFKRRRTALAAARTHRKCRSHGCTFDEMLDLTNPLEDADVIEQFGIEQKLSRAERDRLIRMAAGKIPWFISLSVGVAKLMSISVMLAPPVIVCDPAFVAELPGSDGELLKIGHFDEVGGVTHVEI